MPSSMHRNDALSTKPPAPVDDQALESRFDVIVASVLAKGFVGQIGRTLEKRICSGFVHLRMVPRRFGFLNSHFPIPDSFVHVATVSALEV